MRATDLVVEVRDRDLIRRGQIMHNVLDLRATIPTTAPGEWTLTLPAEHPSAGLLREPGAGIIVTHKDPEVGVLFSGPARKPTVEADTTDPTGILTLVGTTDNVILWNRLAYPSPSLPAGVQAQGYDVRQGAAESVMHAYVSANMGPAAPLSRRIASLSMGPDLARGGFFTQSVRFDRVGEVLADLYALSGVIFDVVQVGNGLVFRTNMSRDRRGFIRLDVHNGTLSSHSATASPPSLTRAVVAGQGEGADRTIVERASAESLAAETAWGPWGRVEEFVDQRQTDDPVELAQAGDKRLVESAGTVAVTAVPSDDQTMRWPYDWERGDTVTVVVEGKEAEAVVASVQVIVNRQGVRVGAGIGEVQAWDPSNGLARRVDSAERRVSNLERNAESASAAGIAPGMMMLGASPIAPTGWLLCDGRAVSRETYPRLYAAIGVTYGPGDGSTTFTLPDMRGRGAIGVDANDATMNTLGKQGGEKKHTLTVLEMPSHTHTQDPHAHGQRVTAAASGGSGIRRDYAGDGASNPFVQGIDTSATTATNQNTGGGAAHNNMQPFITLHHYIAT